MATVPNPAQFMKLLTALGLPHNCVRRCVLVFDVDECVHVLADCYVAHDKLDAAIEACISIATDSGVEMIGK